MKRPEAAPQAAPVVQQAAKNVAQAARVGEAAAETNRAEAPAATEPEARMPAVLLERALAEESGCDVDGQQSLEDRRRLLLALVAVDLAGEDLVGQAEREL